MGFSRQEYWSGLSCPPPGDLTKPGIEPEDLTKPGIEPGSSALQADSLPAVQFSSVQLLSCVRLFATPWTIAHQAPLSIGFFMQEYCSGLPCPPPGGFPDPGMEPTSPASPVLQADPLPLSH